jgi:hypothetical protein
MTEEAARPGEHVERLLEEVESVAGPVAWPRVEALVAALVDLYGTGLQRTVACAREAARSAGELDDHLLRDELIASLLLLHGLHPLGLEQRIGAALARVRTELPRSAPLELVRIDNGIVKLRVAKGNPRDEARPPPTTVVAREIERDAPEVGGVEIEEAAAPELLPVDRLHRKGRP